MSELFGDDFITITDEDGVEYELEVLCSVEYQGSTYLGVCPAGEDEEAELEVPDNWTHERYLNIPMDSLLAKTERAVRNHHGVCWEDENHAMAIVGLAHDEDGERYFIMKNSWGDQGPYNGLEYYPMARFCQETVAVEMTNEAFQN